MSFRSGGRYNQKQKSSSNLPPKNPCFIWGQAFYGFMSRSGWAAYWCWRCGAWRRVWKSSKQQKISFYFALTRRCKVWMKNLQWKNDDWMLMIVMNVYEFKNDECEWYDCVFFMDRQWSGIVRRGRSFDPVFLTLQSGHTVWLPGAGDQNS